MNRLLLLSVLATGLLSSCSTAFRSGQTPDDLYYSPGGEQIAAKEEVKKQKADKEDQDKYDEYISSQDDRYLHMKVANRERWNTLDNNDYWYDSRYDFAAYNSYSYSAYSGYSGFMNPYYNYYSALNPYYLGPGWQFGLGLGYTSMIPGYYGMGGYYGGGLGWSSPLYTVVAYSTPKAISGSASTSNVSAYYNRSYSNANGAYTPYKPAGYAGQNSFGDLVKRVFNGSSSNNTSSSYDRPVRSYSPSSGSNSSSTPSSSAGGSSGGFRSTGTTTSTGRGGKN